MKILVIFTGGTIGSTKSDGFISPSGKSKRTLIENYRRIYCKTEVENIDFDFLEPYSILSENLTAKELNLLIETVRAVLNDNKEDGKTGKYDGIIITHGTDTIQYSAAALGYAFYGARIPIALVSAAYPLDDKRSNGVINFAAAVEFIREVGCGGVFVSYKNAEDDFVSIHYALRTFLHNENDDAIRSIGGTLAAKFCGGRILCGADFKKTESEERRSGIFFTLCEKSNIKVVSPVVGADFSDIDPKNKSAVIIRPYHSGTTGDISGIKRLCRRAKEQNVPVFLVNLKESVRYESTREFENAGLTILPEAAFCAIYMKAWIAQSLNEDVEEFVKTPIGNEFVLTKSKEKM